MRALSIIALAIMAACVSAQSPWQIIESWKQQMPGGRALDIAPAYSSVPELYFYTNHLGEVFAINSTNQQIQWKHTFGDVTFVEAIPALNLVVIGRTGSTAVASASSGEIAWTNSSIIIVSDLTNHGDRTFLVFNNTVVYRENALGFTRLCALDVFAGARIWCDTSRTIGLPDPAYNNTFTAPLFDVNGHQYAANFDVATGTKNWIYPCDTVMTGNVDYVAVAKGNHIVILDSMSGAVVSSRNIFTQFQGTSVMVHSYILAITDGASYVAAINMQTGSRMWNESVSFKGMMQLQHRGDGVLVLAVLTRTYTNFTRFGAYQGNKMWTVSAKPTGMSLAPVHGWLGNDIIYVVKSGGWAAYGVDTGDLISQGTGNLFLPRSVAVDYLEPHVGYFVAGPEGIVYHLKIVPRS